MDLHGTLHIGGQLRQAEQIFEEKHPVVLLKASHLAKLAILQDQAKVHHQGRQMTYRVIRQAGKKTQ